MQSHPIAGNFVIHEVLIFPETVPMRKKLTQASVDKVSPPAEGRVIYWDTSLPGFGLRVSAKGRKTWLAVYRVRGKQVVETFGTTALIPSLADARDLARTSMFSAKRGVNPVAKRREEAAKEAEAAKSAEQNTVEAVYKLYVKQRLRVEAKARTALYVEQYFEKDVLPRLGKRQIDTITSADLRRILEAIQERGAPVGANRMLTRLRTFFRWAVRQEYIANDPSAKLDKPVAEVARDRVLDDDEIKLFWNACGQVGWPYGPLAQLLLLTAQRRSEVAGIEWAELDLAKKLWTIPKERSKNGLAHKVYLSPLAVEILKRVPQINGSRYVFTSQGDKLINSWTTAKAAIDRRMGGDIAHWTFHDLRRTAATGMAEWLKVAPYVVDKILNHASGAISGVAGIYNRAEYLDERRIALDNWSRYLENLLNPAAPSNVIPLAVGTASGS
jgi:integrase